MSMSKRPFKIKMISTLSIFIGIFNIFIFANNVNNLIFFVIGSACIFLGLGLFTLSNRIRILTIIFSIFFIFIYILLIIYTIREYEYHHGFAGIGLIFHFPLLLFCIWALDCLNQPKIKKLFRRG